MQVGVAISEIWQPLNSLRGESRQAIAIRRLQRYAFAMRSIASVIVILGPFAAWADSIDREHLKNIDAAAETAIRRGDCPGAVVLVVHNDEVVFRKAYGQRSLQPDKIAMTADTVFDMASLTKPMATVASAFVLIEQGKLRLSEKVAHYWPEFGANKKNSVTVEHLLLHTSGLTADNALSDYKNGKTEAMKRIAAQSLEAEPGTRFRYSDVGFIVLGELIERISGKPLDEFARTHVFEPLGMRDTMYRPTDQLKMRCAPTAKRDGHWLVGEVHDPRSAAMGGVAGHAGLFSTADDLARYALAASWWRTGWQALPESVGRSTDDHTGANSRRTTVARLGCGHRLQFSAWRIVSPRRGVWAHGVHRHVDLDRSAE